jgi:hypothetical protein
LEKINENSFKTTEELLNWALVVINTKYYLNLYLTKNGNKDNVWFFYDNDWNIPIIYKDLRTWDNDKPWFLEFNAKSVDFKTLYDLITYLDKII